jgi:hypothetical protein
MANTYTQIYIQVIFAVSGRQCLIATRDRSLLRSCERGEIPSLLQTGHSYEVAPRFEK